MKIIRENWQGWWKRKDGKKNVVGEAFESSHRESRPNDMKGAEDNNDYFI